MRTLVICNDPPYGTERSWNGLRLTGALARRDGEEVRVSLLGDAVGCGTCLDARGITDELLVKAAHRATLDDLADWTLWADKVRPGHAALGRSAPSAPGCAGPGSRSFRRRPARSTLRAGG